MFDRFNVWVLLRDHTRSMVKYPTTDPDRVAKFLLYVLPLLAAAGAGYAQYRISDPTALVPATSLLAGTFFAAVGQLISIRARIADSVHLSSNKRLRAHFRESVSGMLLAALAALGVSLLLGGLSLLPNPTPKKGIGVDDVVEVTAVACSAAVFALITYMVLLFVSSARRLYTSYLEAFEGGLPLPKRSKLTQTGVEAAAVDEEEGDDEDDDGEPAGASRVRQRR
jgi:hypothetical protein